MLTVFTGMRKFSCLRYPNLEVNQSLNKLLLARYLKPNSQSVRQIRSQLYDSLQNNDFEAMQNVLYAFFASIPHDWHRRNNIANFEGY